MVIAGKEIFESKLTPRVQGNPSWNVNHSSLVNRKAFQKLCIDLQNRQARPLQTPTSLLRTKTAREFLQRYSWILLLLRSLALISLIELYFLLE